MMARLVEAKRRWEVKHQPACASCGAPCSRGYAMHCTCRLEERRAQRDVRRERIRQMWCAGLLLQDIAQALGTTKAAMATETQKMRRDGWDLPPRRRGRPRHEDDA